ncbi:hypothetical protein [Gordonibacter sp.]
MHALTFRGVGGLLGDEPERGCAGWEIWNGRYARVAPLASVLEDCR